MYTKSKFTSEQVDAMRAMRRDGKTFKQIAKAFGCTRDTARHRISGTKFRSRPSKPPDRAIIHRSILDWGGPVIVPEPVLAERDHRATLSPRDLTAAFFGDPLPGYSALDMRR